MDMKSESIAHTYPSGVALTDTDKCLPLHATVFSEFACAVAMRPDYRAAVCEHVAGQFDGGLFVSYAERLGWTGLADVARHCELTALGMLLVSALERALDGYWTGVPPDWDDPDRIAVVDVTRKAAGVLQ